VCIHGGSFWSQPFITNTPNARLDSSIGRLWSLRWIVFTKALQLGYNVLVTDLDVVWRDSLYKYVKHPALAEFNLFAPHELNNPGINCGLVYAQNAWRDGAISWIASQARVMPIITLHLGDCKLLNP
jgi:hypothetical protein